MIAVFDTSSLLSLVKYYLPLDNTGKIKELIKSKYLNREIRIIDKVFSECEYTAKGIVLNELEFLNPTVAHIKTGEILPDAKFFVYLGNEFCDHLAIKTQKLSTEQVEVKKKEYLNGADCKLMLYSQKILKENPVIVTEESLHGNDGKVHKKIPSNCKFLSLECCTLPELFKNHYQISLTISLSHLVYSYLSILYC